MTTKIGIDFGGTKTEIIAIEGSNGKEIFRKRIPTARDNYDRTVQNIKSLVEEAETTLKTHASVGMGMTGLTDPDTLLTKCANTTWVNGRPLLNDLQDALERSIRIENDANCFAVSEAVDGAGKGYHTVFGVIIGTGCGGGLVVNGKVVSGRNNIAGQWGHNPLPYPKIISEKGNAAFFTQSKHKKDAGIEYFSQNPKWSESPGEMCFCGKRGCLETWISGTGFKMDYQRVEGEEISTHAIIANAKAGDPKAVFALERYTDRMARALSVVINIFDPDAIVLGGGMSKIEEIYQMVPAIWEKYIDSDTVKTKLLPPRHGDSSGVRGAAWLWSNAEHTQALPKTSKRFA